MVGRRPGAAQHRSQQNGGADAALESVGGDVLGAVVGRLRPASPLVWFGSSAGPSSLSIFDFIGHEDVRIQTYFSYAADASRDAEDLGSLLRLVDSGEVVPAVAATWPLEQVDQAVGQLAAGGTPGKIVLVTDPSLA